MWDEAHGIRSGFICVWFVTEPALVNLANDVFGSPGRLNKSISQSQISIARGPLYSRRWNSADLLNVNPPPPDGKHGDAVCTFALECKERSKAESLTHASLSPRLRHELTCGCTSRDEIGANYAVRQLARNYRRDNPALPDISGRSKSNFLSRAIFGTCNRGFLPEGKKMCRQSGALIMTLMRRDDDERATVDVMLVSFAAFDARGFADRDFW